AFGVSVIPCAPVLQTQTLPWRSQGGFAFPVHAFEQAGALAFESRRRNEKSHVMDYLTAFGVSVIPCAPVLQTQTLPWRSQGGFMPLVPANKQA
ncbi:hypothetical protein, partial [Robiginitalea marina]